MFRSRHTATCSNRGFTLIELLAVVVITGVLSLLAVAGFRRHMQAARGTEAAGVIQAIRGAQESYMAENKIYKNVSVNDGGVSWYPRKTPDTKRASWINTKHLDYAAWQELNPPVNRSVMFVYLVNAGPSGSVIPPLQLKSAPEFAGAQPLDWYLIQARGDVDGNNLFSGYASSSKTGELYIENEGE